MSVEVKLIPIKPSRAPVGTKGLARELDAALETEFARAVIDEMTKYPPVTPWKNGFPKKGPRRGGRRTGRLGRNWRITGRRRAYSITVENPVDYAIHVEGPRPGRKGRRQTIVFKRRGWPNISTVSKKHWRRTERAVTRIFAKRRTS
jgi:hypothetical protein